MGARDKNNLLLARSFAERSKDPSTRVGAVCVDEDDVVLSQGWNGFPRGIEDTTERLNDRDWKYEHVVHAEENCFLNAARVGARLKGSTLYVHGLPICHRCAVSAIQVGVQRVVCCSRVGASGLWAESWRKSETLFLEAGMNYRNYDIDDLAFRG